MIRVGIAGVRGISCLAGLRADPDVEVTAFCDLNDDLFEWVTKEQGIPKTFRIYDDMLESGIDAVIIATPMQHHAPQALQALQAGIHVLSEVTVGVNMDELWWLCEEVERSGKVYMMAENYCYMPDNQLILSLVRNGFFGDVYFGEGEYLHELKGLHHGTDGKLTWRNWWQMGRSGCTYPTHSIGPVMQWFEDDHVASVSCFSPGRHTAPEHRQEDTTLTMCQLESGKLVKLRLDMLSNRPHNTSYYSLQGTKGSYEAARGFGDQAKIWLQDFHGSDGENRHWRPLSDFEKYLPERYLAAKASGASAGHGGGDFFQVFDFIQAIKSGTKTPVDIYTAAEWTAVAFLSAESLAQGGKAIPMPKFSR